MITSANLGFPRIGAKRELKKAVESFWKGNSSEAELQETAKELRKTHWQLQKEAGISAIPSNDFSFYDQVLDTIALVGAVPARYNHGGGNVSLDTYFAMARGKQADGVDVTAMEMSKWFDTNYHYIVPEFERGMQPSLSSTKIFDEFEEAKALGIITRPVLLGPMTFCLIGKQRHTDADPVKFWNELLDVYVEVLQKLEAAGAQWVQIDEPIFATDLCGDGAAEQYTQAIQKLADASNLKIMLTTYFEGLRENLDTVLNLPVDGVHLDLVRAPDQLGDALAKFPEGKVLSLGVINGRNIWKANLEDALAVVNKAVEALGSDRVVVAPSCSLLHTPVDLDNEDALDDELKNWLAFSKQKLAEITLLTDAANGNKDEAAFAANAEAAVSRKSSPRIHNDAVKQRVSGLSDADVNRDSPFDERIKLQEANLNLPLLPTTTIGSFPQTAEIRQARAKFKKGELTREEYDRFLEQQTTDTIRRQEELGIDVLVHGEFERNDMVEYFGEKLEGFAFSKFGWVQSYGSRCVKPPIIFGDVSRPEPMTIRWAQYAQSQTERVMKGMLTGPVTILQWSFVRDDQPRSETCKQIAFAVRDEVVDLETAGIRIIQIDEAALREGLPLRKSDWEHYLNWAVQSFRITASGVKDETQIHTHMCYSEFNDIINAVADMDADVISIETSRSAMELLDAFVEFKYPNEIGPGVYDIHSPRIPKTQEMEHLLHKALDVLTPEQTWVNPDCGLKTRGWAEVEPALRNMVEATRNVRARISNGELEQAAQGECMTRTDELIHNLAEEAEPVKTLHSPLVRASAWFGLTALILFVLVPFTGLREDISQKAGDIGFIAEVVALLLAGVCAVLTSFSLSVPDARPRITEYILAGISLLVWVTLIGVSFMVSTMDDMARELQNTNPGLFCTRTVIMLGFIPAVALVYMLRKAAPCRYRLVCFIAILGAFSFGVAGCRLHYGDVPMYVLIWQYAPAILAAVIATVLGEKLLKW